MTGTRPGENEPPDLHASALAMKNDWFENITGFREEGYEQTRSRLAFEGGYLISHVNGSRHGVGRFEAPTLAQLRERSPGCSQAGRRTEVECVVGDARALHMDSRFERALFQVASQFNALEMVSPNVAPEDGVTRYIHDRTQGPACAIAAGAATIWRNYFLPLGGQLGQTATRQLDTLAGLGTALSDALDRPVHALWTMRNGYAMATPEGLRGISSFLRAASEKQRDQIRAELQVAWHQDAEVTDAPYGAQHASRPRVSQVFCSALPVAYTRIAQPAWEPFARLVLEAAYEATMRLAVEQARAGGARTVLLTRLGGGAFGNADAWIDDAITRAFALVQNEGLDVKLVSFGQIHPSFRRMAAAWAGRGD